MHERRFHRDKSRLRAPERVSLMEVDRVVDTSLETFPAKSVLDVGVGTAIFAEAFSARGLSVAGIDANPEMVEASRNLIPGGKFEIGLAEEIPFPDSSYDLVMMSHILHETDDRLKALQEARRVARMGVVVLEWPYDETPGPPLSHRLKPEEIKAMAAQAGFTQIQHLPLKHMNLFLLSSKSASPA